MASGKVIQGLQGCTRYGPDRCFISAYDVNTGKQLWKFNTIAHNGEPGGDTWGKLRRQLPPGRRDVDRRQLRSRSEPHLLGHRAGQAVDAGQPRHVGVRQGALYSASTVALERGRRQAGVALPARARRVARSRRSVRARARRHRAGEVRVHRSARRAFSGSSIVATASSSARRRRSSRTSSTASIRRPVWSPIAPTSSSRRCEQWLQSCPSTEGGHNWQAMSYHQPTNALIIPLQPVVHGDVGRATELHGRRRRHRRRSPLLRDAGQRRQRRQARRLRRRRR